MDTQFFYRLDTFQIDAVYRDCQSSSTKFKDPAVYAEVNVKDPPYDVTRNHVVILFEGAVVDTDASLNPVQPQPTLLEAPESFDLKSPDGTIWTIKVDDSGKVNSEKKPK